MIKYGSIEYFSLLSLRDKINYSGWDKFDLSNLDKLRTEVEIKIKAIELSHKEQKNKTDETDETEAN